MKKNFKNKTHSKRILAAMLALFLALTSASPITSFAGIKSNAATVVDSGGTVFYDKDGKKVDSFDNAAVQMSKTIKKLSGENEFEITLAVTPKKDTFTTKGEDAAVVLVLDASISMNDYIDKNSGNPRKIEAAKDAAKKFLESYVKNAGTSKRMVSVVQFGLNAKRTTSWIDANNNGTVSVAAKNAVDAVKPGFVMGANFNDSGETNIEAGLMIARNLIAKESTPNVKDIDNISVVMLTDGVPTAHMAGDKTDSERIAGDLGGRDHATEPDWKDIPSLCTAINDLGSAVYTVSYDVNGKDPYYDLVNGKSVADWLTNVVRVTANYPADNAQGLFDAFSKINGDIQESIVTEMGTITDPMGQYILFDKTNNSLNDKTTFDGNTLRIKLSKSDVLDEKGEPKTFSYSYKVKLDTAAPGFEDNKVYDANGKTTLSYKYGADAQNQEVEFKIPSVKGLIPEVPYTIEYYKWDKEKKDYPADATETAEEGTAKLWSEIQAPDGYMDAYRSESYHFVKGETKLQLSSQTGNVLKLFYKPDEVNVTVNHHYKTSVIEENGTEIPADKYVLGNTTTAAVYVGDKYIITPISGKDGIEYTLNKETSGNLEFNVSSQGDTVNLYYDGTNDKRQKTSITVNRIYETGKWVLNTDSGRLEEKFTAGLPQEYEKSTEVRTHSTYSTSTTKDVTAGYTYVKDGAYAYDEAANTVSMKLAASPNVMNLTFRKPAPESDRTATNVIVNHTYVLTTKEIVDGELKITTAAPVIDKEEHKDYFVGEYFTPTEKNLYGDITYNSDDNNQSKLVRYELTGNTAVITLNYNYTIEPEKTDVTVNHIYRSFEQVYTPNIDPETGEDLGGVFETVRVESGKDSATIDSIMLGDEESDLYEGYNYAAKPNGEYEGINYTLNTKDSDSEQLILGEKGTNEINLYYDITEDTSASVYIHHIYVTNKKTVVNGKVTTIIEGGVGKVVPITGKALDVIDVVKEPTYKDNDYTLRPDNNFTADTYTLKAGSNKTIEIVYERFDSDLKAAFLSVTHKYLNKIMTVVEGVAGYYEPAEVVAEVTDFTVDDGKKLDLDGLYAGEKYKIDLAPKYLDVDYGASTSNPATNITLGEGNNDLVFEYETKTALPTTDVTVNHHYSHTTIDSVGNSNTSEETDTVTKSDVYVGTNVTATAALAGYDFKSVSVTGTDDFKENPTAHDVVMTVSNSAVTVDYYYTKTTDNSVKSTWTVNHYYRTLDWNDTKEKEYTLDKDLMSSGNACATQTITGVPNLKPDDSGNATFALDRAKASSDFTDGYTITLAEGANTIDFYYTQEIDSRVDTVVKVVHNYYKHDTSGLVPDTAIGSEVSGGAITTLPGVLAGSYEEVFTGKNESAWVGNKFVAEKKTVYGEAENQLVYTFKDANPENLTIDTLALTTTDNPNLIVINYVYAYDANENVSMKINHVYKTLDTYTNTATEEITSVTSKFGNSDFGSWNKDDKTFTAKEASKSGFTRGTPDANMTVTYSAGDNEMTVIYSRTTSSRPGGGGGGGSTGGGGGGNTGGGGVNIPDEDVPLGDTPLIEDVILPDELVPLGDAPVTDETVIIGDEAVPLAGLPKTGGLGVLGFLFLGGILTTLGAVLKRRESKNINN